MKLQKSVSITLPQYHKPSVCEACGETFICGATDSGCWCQEVELSEAAREKLRARYQGCLCRVCLENIAEGENKNG